MGSITRLLSSKMFRKTKTWRTRNGRADESSKVQRGPSGSRRTDLITKIAKVQPRMSLLVKKAFPMRSGEVWARLQGWMDKRTREKRQVLRSTVLNSHFSQGYKGYSLWLNLKRAKGPSFHASADYSNSTLSYAKKLMDGIHCIITRGWTTRSWNIHTK